MKFEAVSGPFFRPRQGLKMIFHRLAPAIHSVVEKAVDNFVYNLPKSVNVTILCRFAAFLSSFKVYKNQILAYVLRIFCELGPARVRYAHRQKNGTTFD